MCYNFIHWCDNEDGNENTDNSNYRDICDRKRIRTLPKQWIEMPLIILRGTRMWSIANERSSERNGSELPICPDEGGGVNFGLEAVPEPMNKCVKAMA